MQLTDKLEKWYTWTLVFLDKEWNYFSSMEFRNLKNDIHIVYILRSIVQRKTLAYNLLVDKKKKDLVKYFKWFSVITGSEYVASQSQNSNKWV